MTATTLDIRKYKALLTSVLPVAIQIEEEYERMLAAAGKLMEIPEEKMTEEQGRLLSLLAILIEKYEDEHYPVPRAPRHEMLAFLLEQRRLTPKDLWPVIGSKSRVSEMLAGKRPLTKEQAKKLAGFFHVQVDLFL
jgi:HTH-type transcriptional regulator/antitoxin HigA